MTIDINAENQSIGPAETIVGDVGLVLIADEERIDVSSRGGGGGYVSVSNPSNFESTTGGFLSFLSSGTTQVSSDSVENPLVQDTDDRGMMSTSRELYDPFLEGREQEPKDQFQDTWPSTVQQFQHRNDHEPISEILRATGSSMISTSICDEVTL